MNLFISRQGGESALQVRRFVLIGSALAAMAGASVALAQAPASGSDEPAQAQAEMQPQAVDALNKLGNYLRSLKSFRIQADSVTDAVLTTGQNVGFLHRTEMSVQRPNKVRVVVTGSRAPKGLIYDGRTFVLFNDTHHFYSKVPAPPTIRQLITDADEKYGVQLPLVDLFYWGEQSDDEKSLTSALFIGLDKVDGKWCNHYAYQQPGLDWELWIQSGSRPLPCRFVVTDTTQPSRPQHAVNYQWTLNPTFEAGTFTFRPGPDARQIPMRPPAISDDQQGDAQ
ncbi:DUF2092 domain-containing protein [Paraburkholderia phenazinium]|uniref:DUF2092 domain-containing protein n=1 Tax=Paraburkholderia phenazinium TaxID=60549 RepID=A0A1N6HMP2_9BURK|nr:DUF2092 domain-containing protein [Paraburkholderia phenazinium]SIO21128.1 hypothetical protein SAMN05444165_1477 [Paraburkholderia phenazinium]